MYDHAHEHEKKKLKTQVPPQDKNMFVLGLVLCEKNVRKKNTHRAHLEEV